MTARAGYLLILVLVPSAAWAQDSAVGQTEGPGKEVPELIPVAPTPQSASLGAGPLAWAQVNYLYWRVRGSDLPPLVSASEPGTPVARAGVLDRPGTVTLFGGDQPNPDWRQGVRLRAGLWLDESRSWGVELSALYLAGSEDGGIFASPGDPILGRPFVNALTARAAAQRVSFPGDLAGSAAVADPADPFCGAGVYVRKALCCRCDDRVDVLAGFRYLRFADSLAVLEDLAVNPANPAGVPAGTTFDLLDQFAAVNEFAGADVGLAGQVRLGPVILAARGTVSVGLTQRTTEVAGYTQTTVPGLPTVIAPGGLLALPSNVGTRRDTSFSVVPEVGAQVRLVLCPGVSVGVGCSALYWSGVARAGDLIDPVVNPTLLPGAPPPVIGQVRPVPVFPRSGLWVYGFDVGLSVSF